MFSLSFWRVLVLFPRWKIPFRGGQGGVWSRLEMIMASWKGSWHSGKIDYFPSQKYVEGSKSILMWRNSISSNIFLTFSSPVGYDSARLCAPVDIIIIWSDVPYFPSDYLRQPRNHRVLPTFYSKLTIYCRPCFIRQTGQRQRINPDFLSCMFHCFSCK